MRTLFNFGAENFFPKTPAKNPAPIPPKEKSGANGKFLPKPSMGKFLRTRVFRWSEAEVVSRDSPQNGF